MSEEQEYCLRYEGFNYTLEHVKTIAMLGLLGGDLETIDMALRQISLDMYHRGNESRLKEDQVKFEKRKQKVLDAMNKNRDESKRMFKEEKEKQAKRITKEDK